MRIKVWIFAAMARLAAGATLAELQADLESRFPSVPKGGSRRCAKGAKGGANKKKSSAPVARKKRARPQELDAHSDASDANDSGSDSDSSGSELNKFIIHFARGVFSSQE